MFIFDDVNSLGALGRSYMDAQEVDVEVSLSDDFDTE